MTYIGRQIPIQCTRVVGRAFFKGKITRRNRVIGVVIRFKQNAMSFIHSTIVGHFDPATLTAINRSVLRPLDIESAKLLLADFDAHVATQIAFHDGYVQCWWADGNFGCSKPTHDYAYRLAETLNCVAAETPVCYITFPAVLPLIALESP